MTLQRKSSRCGYSSLLALLVAGSLSAATMAHADTPVSVTEISYDVNLRPLCAAVRMNPANFGNAPADACTVQQAGSFGPDRITKTIYDAASHVIEIDRGVGSGAGFLNQKYARYTYSGNGLKTSEMDANGNKTILIYDSFDRLSQMQYPSTTVGSGGVNTADYETFGYDNNGNRTSWRRRNGYTIGYGYDNLNREIVQDVPASPGNTNGTDKDMSTGYDLQGRIKTKTFGNGLTVSYTYDALGRVNAASDVANRINFYQYNQASARTYLTMPDGNWVNYGLDYTNRLVSINHNSAGILFTQAYDNLGRRVSLGRGSSNGGGSTTYGYDNLNRLTTLTNDIAGTGNDITWTFSSYNPASQVMSWGTSSILFDYKELFSTTDNRTYNGLNQDASIAVLSGGYDDNANLANDGTRAMTYDIYNRLLTVSGGGANLQLDYDPEGRLYKYTSNGTTTYFSYDGTNLIGEYSALATLRQYIHGTGTDEPVVWFEGSGTADRRYLYQNYQGSVIAYTDASGNLSTANLYKYGPYGEPKNASDAESWSGSRFRYTGQTIIPEAKLYYYKARVYDPAMGRFLQTDPVGSKDDLDLYAYVGGDPVNKSDPTGNEGWGVTLGSEEWSSGHEDGTLPVAPHYNSSGLMVGFNDGRLEIATYSSEARDDNVQGKGAGFSVGLGLYKGTAKDQEKSTDVAGGATGPVGQSGSYTVDKNGKIDPKGAGSVALPPVKQLSKGSVGWGLGFFHAKTNTIVKQQYIQPAAPPPPTKQQVCNAVTGRSRPADCP